MHGYWEGPEETEAVLTPDGHVRTGDAGCLRNGYLCLRDRLQNVIVSGGENVYPVEVERVLLAHPQIADAAVIGVPSEKWRETVRAVVVWSGLRSALTENDVIACTKESLAGYKCPTAVDFVDVLPRNPSGKVLKRVLREPYWTGRARGIG
ncbi:AMP-binding enzyme [Streptomyces thinghirensis]|uniref:AMP-binding enzyme C-terminal domain-containing protein n=1 Tax=Streptomyces thinghirensis TaxID=551547 RepID=A0ABP9T8J0_9ACTN